MSQSANPCCECRPCCSYPNGNRNIFATITVILSYILTLFTIYGCHYVDVDPSQVVDLNLPTERNFGFGLYTREHDFNFDDLESEWEDWDNYACYSWKDVEQDALFDSKWRAARAMGQISAVLGFILMILTLAMACTSFSSLVVRLMALAALLASVSVLLTLVAFASDICNDFHCDFSDSAGTSIAASFLFFVSACLLAAISTTEAFDGPQAPATPTGRPVAAVVEGSIQPPAGSVTVTETVLPDGTKKFSKVIYNVDGSRTVQQTVERPNSVVVDVDPEDDEPWMVPNKVV